jgi:hypothetical protein
MALIILERLGLLTICGLATAWLLDWLSGGTIAIAVTNPIQTPYVQEVGFPIGKYPPVREPLPNPL